MTGAVVVVAVTSAAAALADDVFFFFFPLPLFTFVDLPDVGLLVPLDTLPNTSSVSPNKSSSVTVCFFFFATVFSFFGFLSSEGIPHYHHHHPPININVILKLITLQYNDGFIE